MELHETAFKIISYAILDVDLLLNTVHSHDVFDAWPISREKRSRRSRHIG